MRIFFALLLITGVSSCASAQDYMLKLNLKEGQRFSLTSVINMDMTMNVGGQDMQIATKINFIYGEEVKSISTDGSFRLELSFTRIGMDMDGGIAKISYDTDKKNSGQDAASGAMAKALEPLLKRKFYATVSSTGKILSIEGLKELVDSLSNGMDATSAQMLQNIASEEKMKSSLQASYGYLPDHRIKIGDTWTQNIKMDITIPVNTDLVYTLKSVKGNTASVTIKADSHSKDDNYQMSGTSMKIDLQNKMDGTGELDMNTGIFSKTHMSINMTGSMEAMGSTIPITAIGTTETSIVSQK